MSVFQLLEKIMQLSEFSADRRRRFVDATQAFEASLGPRSAELELLKTDYTDQRRPESLLERPSWPNIIAIEGDAFSMWRASPRLSCTGMWRRQMGFGGLGT